MQSAIRPVISNQLLSITSMASWNSTLFLGTENQGLVIYKVQYTTNGERKGVIDSVHKDISWGEPIKQLDVAIQKNLLFVLSLGEIIVHSFTCDQDERNFSFSYVTTLPYKRITKFSLVCCSKGGQPSDTRLCFFSVDHFYLFEAHCGTVVQLSSVEFDHDVMDLVLLQDLVYVAYNEQYTGLYKTTTFSIDKYSKLMNKHPTPSPTSIPLHFTPVILQRVNAHQLLLHNENISTIYTTYKSTGSLMWSILPDKITTFGDHFIGASGNSVEILNLSSAVYKLPQEVKCISESYIATNKSVWEVITFTGNLFTPSPLTSLFPGLSPSPSPSPSLSLSPSLAPQASQTQQTIPPKAPMLSKEQRLETRKGRQFCLKNIVDGLHLNTPADPLPEDFSPESSPAILGLTIGDMGYLARNGMHTIQLFVQNFNSEVSKRYWEPYFRAVHLLNLYYAKDLEKKDSLQATLQKTANTSPNWEFINPEDPLDVLGLSKDQIEFLSGLNVFTVRQFAMLHIIEFQHQGEEIMSKHDLANKIIKNNSVKSQTTNNITENLIGYVYLSQKEFDDFVKNKALKSAYMLFQEYMECTPETRATHAWKEVYARHYQNAKKYFNENTRPLTDADVFSYLCWKQVPSIAKLDITAGARAFFFYWNMVPPHEYSKLLVTNSFFTKLLRINLTNICNNYGGKIFVKSEPKEKEWQEVQITNFIPPNTTQELVLGAYANPTGCIVLPSGTITDDCVFPLALS